MERFKLKDPLKQRSTTKDIEGYIDTNGCFICDSYAPSTTIGKRKRGYYHITRVVNGIKTSGIALHRYVYETYNDCRIKDGIVVRHKCDNPLCINPDHLELGTHQDNMRDMVERGRSTKGEKNSSSKLTSKQVDEIRVLIEEGNLTQLKIAELYGVNGTTITHIKKGYTHVI